MKLCLRGGSVVSFMFDITIDVTWCVFIVLLVFGEVIQCGAHVIFFPQPMPPGERLQLLTMGGFSKLNFAKKCQVWFSTGCFFFGCWKRHNCTPENVLISYSILCCRGCAKEDLYSLNQFLVRPTTAPGDVSWLEICRSRSSWGQDTSVTVSSGFHAPFQQHVRTSESKLYSIVMHSKAILVVKWIIDSLNSRSISLGRVYSPPPRRISLYPKP